jgi:hypothetical protein
MPMPVPPEGSAEDRDLPSVSRQCKCGALPCGGATDDHSAH